MRVRDAFAYPFKVLRDVFTDLPSVPDPEFTRFDLNALWVEDSEAGRASEPRPVRAKRDSAGRGISAGRGTGRLHSTMNHA